MAQVKSRGNRSTEWRLRAGLMRAGIRGWNLNPPGIPGNPDFVFLDRRVALFVDGCYWHGCPKCYRRPSSNVAYWDAKVARNRARDLKNTARLRRQGWRVLRIWEHELLMLSTVLERIKLATNAQRSRAAGRLLN